MKYIDTYNDAVYPTEEEAREAVLDHFDDLDFERWLNTEFANAATMFFAIVNNPNLLDELYYEALEEYIDDMLKIEEE